MLRRPVGSNLPWFVRCAEEPLTHLCVLQLDREADGSWNICDKAPFPLSYLGSPGCHHAFVLLPVYDNMLFNHRTNDRVSGQWLATIIDSMKADHYLIWNLGNCPSFPGSTDSTALAVLNGQCKTVFSSLVYNKRASCQSTVTVVTVCSSNINLNNCQL